MAQKIYFVTGKGGVGKSLYALSLATRLSQKANVRGLLVELGEQSFYRAFLQLPQVEFQPVPLEANLDIARWAGADCLREYAKYFLKVESLVNLFFENRVMKTFVDVAPALAEIAILGKLTSGIRKHGPPLDYDFIVVDAFSTGHFKSLLEAPQGLAEVIQMGPMGEQSKGIVEVLSNPKFTQFHLVTLPEALPAKEASELGEYLQKKWNADLEIILNKALPDDWNSSDFSGEFARSFEFKLENQKEALELLRAFEIRRLPFIPDLKPETLVQRMSQEITWM